MVSRSAITSVRFALGRESPALCPVEAGPHAYEGGALLDDDLGLGRAVLLELRQRGVGRDRVDELGEREDLLDLAALELPDEVPAELGMRGRLGLELLGAVLAEQLEAGLAQDRQVLERDVFDGGEQLDLRGVAAGLGCRLG